jgi:hypothetical protein
MELLGKKDRQAKAAGLELVRLLDESMARGLPHAGCQRGMLHLRDGNRKAAVECYRHSAALGNPVAMCVAPFFCFVVDPPIYSLWPCPNNFRLTLRLIVGIC